MTLQECKSLVFCCSDFRLVEPIKTLLNSKHLTENYDLVSLNGGISELINLKENFWITQIEKSILGHHITEVILIAHTDCGAFGGRENFESMEEEYNYHVKDIKKAKELILNKFVDLKVKLILVKINPLGQINFEEDV